jgi:hypothetical protein
MAQNTNNILVGAASVAVGKYSGDYTGTSDGLWTAVKNSVGGSKDFRNWTVFKPTASGGAPVAVTPHGGTGTATFRDVGLTQEGVEVQYQPDFGEVEVDQILDAAKLFKQKMTVSVATTFAEATLENLLTVWAQSAGTLGPDAIGGDSLYLVPGELGQAPLEQALMFVGNAPGTISTYKQRVYLAARALSVESSTSGIKRAEATVFPVTFRLLPDTAASYSAYGRVVDVT